jgi:hypothetical protein
MTIKESPVKVAPADRDLILDLLNSCADSRHDCKHCRRKSECVQAWDKMCSVSANEGIKINML